MLVTAPFDAERLDALLDEASADVVVATSWHNVFYLVGSYSAFFASFDAIGVDRYLPAVALMRGRLDDAFAIGHEVDTWLHEVEPPWVPALYDVAQTAAETARVVAEQLRARGFTSGTVALEQSFAPYRFVDELARELPAVTLVEAAPILEELRAVKRPDELARLRRGAESIVDAIAAAAAEGPELTKSEIAERLRMEEETRGIHFEYCLVAAGASVNRAPSAQRWVDGVLSLDSGGGTAGTSATSAGWRCVASPRHGSSTSWRRFGRYRTQPERPSAPGRPAQRSMPPLTRRARASPTVSRWHSSRTGWASYLTRPRDCSAETPIRYQASHRDRSLQTGMVLSIETDLRLDGIGLIKLEDTVAVTADGCDAYGDAHRDWIVA